MADTATILIADRPALERLTREGGLRSSFIAVFGGSLFDTADDTPRGDGVGLDDLLDRHRIVCIDRTLFASLDESLPDRPERERYRHNLVLKLASRQHAWLTVIEDKGKPQLDSLESLKKQLRDAWEDAGARRERRTLVILVFTKEMEPESRELVRKIRDDVPGVSRVYLMTHRLQPADRGSRAITSHAVWPICAARLLAARSILGAHREDKPEIAVWRTLEWGGGRNSDWTPVYRTMLRERLMPPDDHEGSEVKESLERVREAKEGTVDERPETPPECHLQWKDSAEELHDAGFLSVDDSVFERLLRDSGARSLGGRTLQSGIERADGVAKEVASGWESVADRDNGLRKLRRLADGRGWPMSDLKSAVEEQRIRWGKIITRRRELSVSRENHRDATEELAVARARHLSLLWRMVIAAAMMVFLGQFIASVLVPFVPAGVPITGPDQFRFLGLTIDRGQSVAFLVDCSGSMVGERIDALKSELRRAIDGLGKGTSFTIVGFNESSPEELVLPAGRLQLVAMDDGAKQQALAFIDGLSAGGGTDPTEGLARILKLDPAPYRIVLMTDGEFANRDAVRKQIFDFESANAGRNLPKVDTVAMWWRGEEPFLRAMSERTDGTYSFVGFDPFAPYGFTTVITVVLAATALGVATGVFLPLWLEVIRGRLGVASLQKSLAGLLREFCHVSWDTQKLLQDSGQVRTEGAVNAAGAHQRALGKRIFSVVDRVLANAGIPASTASAGGFDHTGDALAGEDRRDLARALDTSFQEVKESVDTSIVKRDLQPLADEHARDLRRQWADFCVKFDRAHAGYLPVWEAEQTLKSHLERHCNQSALNFLFQRVEELAKKDCSERIDKCVGELDSRIMDGAVPTCLSARIKLTGGAFPRRSMNFVWVRPKEGTFPAVAQLVQEVRTSVTGQHRAAAASHEEVEDLGLVALGLIHEELPVDLNNDASQPEYDVVARARQ
jgi:hypothetical protein